MLVAIGTTLGEPRLRLAVEPLEHAADHTGVDRAQHVRPSLRRLAERAMFGDQCQRVPRASAWAANPSAVSASATDAPRPSPSGVPPSGIRAAMERP